jgi:hypothetical protein
MRVCMNMCMYPHQLNCLDRKTPVHVCVCVCISMCCMYPVVVSGPKFFDERCMYMPVCMRLCMLIVLQIFWWGSACAYAYAHVCMYVCIHIARARLYDLDERCLHIHVFMCLYVTHEERRFEYEREVTYHTHVCI